jgi:hypothetical protein
MALFSDIDWVILLAAAGFLLLGKDNSQLLRTIGRWYGRATQLKQELLAEFSKAADLPVPAQGQLSLRGALLGLDPAPPRPSGVPAAVTSPPAPTVRPIEPAWGPWTGGYPVPTWSMTVPAVLPDPERSR